MSAAFVNRSAAQLSAKTRTSIDALLNTESPLEDENSQFRQSQLSYLKTDPGRLGLKSLLKEIEKLQHIRELKLPLSSIQSSRPQAGAAVSPSGFYRTPARAKTPSACDSLYPSRRVLLAARTGNHG